MADLTQFVFCIPWCFGILLLVAIVSFSIYLYRNFRIDQIIFKLPIPEVRLSRRGMVLDVEDTYNQGIHFMLIGEMEKAVIALRRVVATDPYFKDAQLRLVEVEEYLPVARPPSLHKASIVIGAIVIFFLTMSFLTMVLPNGPISILVSMLLKPTAISTPALTPSPQVITVVITATPSSNTPEPATVTPLPSTTLRPAVTGSPTSPVAAAATGTTAPTCSLGTVTLLFPDNGAPRNTSKDGTSGSAFDLKWTSYQTDVGDPKIGYKIMMVSKRGDQLVNEVTIYVSHNDFVQNGNHYIYLPRNVSQLARGDNAIVSWNVTIIKTSGEFDGKGGVSGNVIACGPPSQTWTIQLIVN